MTSASTPISTGSEQDANSLKSANGESQVVTTEMKDVEMTAVPEPPKEPYTAFSPGREMFIVLVATAAGFFSPVTGAVYLPSLVLFERVFNTSAVVINASVSVFWAVFGVAPLFGAVASDYLGRKGVYIISLALYLVVNALLAAVPPTVGGLFALRIFQAIGASMATSVGAGTVADVTEPAKRASRMGIFLLGPQLGPLIGPLIGGQFSDMSRWRWVFGFLCIACIPVYTIILFVFPETLRCLVGNGSYYAGKSWFVMPRLKQKQVVPDGKYPKPPKPSVKGLLGVLLFVPNFILCCSMAFNFAGLSSMYITFPRVWQTKYGWSGSETGYAYLAPGVGLTIASFAIGRLGDFMYKRFQSKHDGKAPPPEKRLDLQVYAYVIAAVGKTLYGWIVVKHYHPAAGLAAATISAAGTGIIMVLSTSYQTEAMPSSAAALVAIAGLMRQVAAAIAGAIIDSLLKAMGYGWCFTGLAILDLVCILGLVFIRTRGHVYRAKLMAQSK